VTVHQGASDSPTEAASVVVAFLQYRVQLRIFFARRARRAANVDDLVQEVYERLLRYPSTEPIRNPQAYFFEVARNLLRVANKAAREEEQRYLSCEPDELEGRLQGLSSLWVQEDGGRELAEGELERVLNQMPRTCRVALLRQRRDGWSYQQIADELGVSTNTVKDYLSRAFHQLRIHFSLRPER